MFFSPVLDRIEKAGSPSFVPLSSVPGRKIPMSLYVKVLPT